MTLVGHDVGGMVAFAYAQQFPAGVERLVIADVPLPGVSPWEMVEKDPRSWHFQFHTAAGLPEALIRDRQRIYFRHFYDKLSVQKKAITDEDVARYAASYATADQLTAGFDFYRAFPADAKRNADRATPAVKAPVLLVGGEGTSGPFLPDMAEGLRSTGAGDVRSVEIKGAGHWVPEEQPAAFVAAVNTFLDSKPGEGTVRPAKATTTVARVAEKFVRLHRHGWATGEWDEYLTLFAPKCSFTLPVGEMRGTAVGRDKWEAYVRSATKADTRLTISEPLGVTVGTDRFTFEATSEGKLMGKLPFKTTVAISCVVRGGEVVEFREYFGNIGPELETLLEQMKTKK